MSQKPTNLSKLLTMRPRTNSMPQATAASSGASSELGSLRAAATSKLLATRSSRISGTMIEPSTSAGTTSQYFSPRRTRNHLSIGVAAKWKDIKLKTEPPSDEKCGPATTVNSQRRQKTIKPETSLADVKPEPQQTASRVKRAVIVKQEPDTSPLTIRPKSETCSTKVALKRAAVVKQEPESPSKIRPKSNENSPKQSIVVKQEPQSPSSVPPQQTIETQSTDISPSKQSKWQPAKWRETLQCIRQMRDKRDAPVDTMGCHRCQDPQADERTQRYQILVALQLSSQTKDQVTYEAMGRLKAMDGGLRPQTVAAMALASLEKMLYPVSFYRNKAKYLQQTAAILLDRHASDIPATYAELLQLPGVGPKMAHICMSAAWHHVTGIGVDTHVHRITNRLRWTPAPTADAERTRAALEQWLPEDLWPEVNTLLVGFGQQICTPLRPRCGQCLLADVCPSRGVKQ